MTRLSCEICKSENIEKIHKGTRDNPSINVYECKNCKLKFLVNNNELADYYSEGGMHQGDINQSVESRIKELEDEDVRKAEEVKQIIENHSVLDFGCGYGGAIRNMMKYASIVKGVELEKDAVKYLEKNNIEVKQNIADYNEKFDVITLFHVFEHLNNPREVLCTFKDYLNDDGILFLEIPHANDALLELYKCKKFEDFTYWSPHIYLYNRKTIQILANDCNYEIVNIRGVQRYSIGNHLYWLSNGKPGGHKVWDFLESETLKREYEKTLEEKEMTDTLLITLKVKK